MLTAILKELTCTTKRPVPRRRSTAVHGANASGFSCRSTQTSRLHSSAADPPTSSIAIWNSAGIEFAPAGPGKNCLVNQRGSIRRKLSHELRECDGHSGTRWIENRYILRGRDSGDIDSAVIYSDRHAGRGTIGQHGCGIEYRGKDQSRSVGVQLLSTNVIVLRVNVVWGAQSGPMRRS